jgi:hypothetical protein
MVSFHLGKRNSRPVTINIIEKKNWAKNIKKMTKNQFFYWLLASSLLGHPRIATRELLLVV